MGQYSAPMSRQGSYGQAIQTYMPIYAPPSVPIPEMLVTGNNIAQRVPAVSQSPVQGSMVVNRRNRQLGMRFLFARGAKAIRQFLMISTGQVASSQFEPRTAWTWSGAFDDAHWQMGWPGTNLGISLKVPTIPKEALGTAPWQMQPRPQWRRSIITNRSYGGAAGVPAQPMNYGRQ